MSIKARAGETKSLSTLISKDRSRLGQIFSRAEKLKQLERLVMQELPEDCRNFYRLGNYQQGRLVLLTSSALNLTRFRYLKPALLQRLQYQLPQLEKIELKIRPEKPPLRQEKKGRPLSETNRKKLRDLAEDIDNLQLKKALKKLGGASQD